MAGALLAGFRRELGDGNSRRAAAGEEAAIAALPEVYYDEVLVAVLARRYPNAKEAVQEAFARVVTQCRGGMEVLKMPQYARTIALNVACDAARRPSERPLGDEDPDTLVGADAHRASPSDRLHLAEVSRLYEEALAQESDRNQRLIRGLIETPGSQPELASAFGVSDAVVRNVVFRFRSDLKARLRREGYEP